MDRDGFENLSGRMLPRRVAVGGIVGGVLRGLAAGAAIGAGVAAGGDGVAAPAVAGKRRKGRKGRKSKFKTVTKTFREWTPINILPVGQANPYGKALPVSGFKSNAKITKVTVTLHGLSHGHGADLDILLQGPAPAFARCIVMSDAIDIPVFNVTYTFSDAAASSFPREPAITPPSGVYRPTNYEGDQDFGAAEPVSLARFNGLKPNGDWRLYIADDSSGDSGSVAGGWSITISAKQRR